MKKKDCLNPQILDFNMTAAHKINTTNNRPKEKTSWCKSMLSDTKGNG